MDELSYKVTLGLRKGVNVYIERNVCHVFRTKNEANEYIKKHKKTTHDNVIMLHSVKNQLDNVKAMFYPFFNEETKRYSNRASSDFEQAFYDIYHNMGGSERVTVQFNKIRLSFDYLEDQLLIMKRFAQKYKLVYMLTQLEPLEKFFHLILHTYNVDIKTLYVSDTIKKGRLIPLNETSDNEKYIHIPVRGKAAK